MGGLVPPIPAEIYLEKVRSKRRIQPKQFKDCVTNNPVSKYTLNNNKCFKIPDSVTPVYKNSFFPRTIIDWNQLNDNTVNASSVESFKTQLQNQ